MNSSTIAKGGEIYLLRQKTQELFTPSLQIQTYKASLPSLRPLTGDLPFFGYALQQGMLRDASALLFADGFYAPSDTLDYLKGLAAFEIRDFNRAAECFSALEGTGPLLEGARLFLDTYSAAPALPETYKARSPYLAAAMSAVIPGAGKIYAGDIHSGVSTFLIVGALAGMLAETWVKCGPRDWKTISLGSLFGLFYIGNVYGSYLSVSIMENAISDAQKAALLFNIRIPLHDFSK